MGFNSISIDPILRDFGRVFAKNGFQAFLVGGAVRDAVLGKRNSDWDVATNATPAQVQSMFRAVIPTGIKHGTVTVHFRGASIETTTFRAESDYSDGRRPDSVRFAATIDEDLSRRDFTMNAMAADLSDGRIIDLFGGKNDLKRRLIRTVGDANERFGEDGLRPVRAIRFASQLGFSIDDATFRAIGENLDVVKKISIERFRDEFVKTLLAKNCATGLDLLEKTGILAYFLPEIAAEKGVTQGELHRFDVLNHLFFTAEGMQRLIEDDFGDDEKTVLSLAAVLHDVAKNECREEKSDGKITFYTHESLSAKTAQAICERLHFSTAICRRVALLVQNHMFNYSPDWTDAAVRRFLARLDVQHNEKIVSQLFDLRRADAYGMTRSPQVCANLDDFENRILAQLDSQNALSVKNLALNGNDLIALGVEPGKKIGYLLEKLLETVLESPELNEREKLLEIASKMLGGAAMPLLPSG